MRMARVPGITVEILSRIKKDPELTDKQKAEFFKDTLRGIMETKGVEFNTPEAYVDYLKRTTPK